MQLIDINTPLSEIQALLLSLNWISDERIVNVTIPGEGNMNVVLRIKTNLRTFILKQSRPFVQKYPDLPAPAERIDVEFQFYNATKDAIKGNSANVLNYSPANHLMMIEDLGACEDMVTIYESRNITDAEIKELVDMAEQIHNQSTLKDYPENIALRQLNHQHIFHLPFLIDNGFQLDEVQPGLQELSMLYKKDDDLKSIIKELGDRYLDSGTDLIHGDYYPGSWMKSNDKIYVIDAEFSFVGFKEFDLGVMAAHLILSTSDINYLDKVVDHYRSIYDKNLVTQIAGIEIIRRLIGLAQLPLERTLEEKAELLKMARGLIIN